MIRLPVAADPDAIPVHPNCARCPAACCNYISTEIDVPTTKREIDIIRWYLMHAGVRVYCEDRTGSWFVQFMSRCRFLGEDHRCQIYEIRPQICRDLQADECEFALGAGDRYLFTTLEEFDRWLQERDRRTQVRREKRARSGGRERHRNGRGARTPNGRGDRSPNGRRKRAAVSSAAPAPLVVFPTRRA